MHLFIHALGASAGGGLTYLRNVVRHFAEHPEVRVSFLASRNSLSLLPVSENIHPVEHDTDAMGTLSRFLWEQRHVPELVKRTGADVLLCTGNFAVWKSPVPQILLSRNSLYTSADFARDLRRRGEYRLLADTRLKGYVARKSIARAELVVAPSLAFARELKNWAQRDVTALHHGFDRDEFFRDPTPLPPAILEKLGSDPNTVRLLFVSHYNYYRNFETLLRGLALLKRQDSKRRIQLVLTCELVPGRNPGSYRTDRATGLLRELQIAGDVVQLGSVSYPQLHHVYRACQIYVTPAYTETFAHPLVEAMACGLPIVASDIEVHREITVGGAIFFERFSAEDLASKVSKLAESPLLQAEVREKGMSRCAAFSWKAHVDKLIEFARSLADGRANADPR